MNNRFFKKGLSAFAVILLSVSAFTANAATLTMVPSVGPITLGSTFTIDFIASGFTVDTVGGQMGNVSFNSTTSATLGAISLIEALTTTNAPFDATTGFFSNAGTLDVTGTILSGLRSGAFPGVAIADGTSVASLYFTADTLGFIDILFSPVGWADSFGGGIAVNGVNATVEVVNAVPVPPAVLLFMTAIAGLGISGRRKKA